jgi:predicted nucleic acid-binding protein
MRRSVALASIALLAPASAFAAPTRSFVLDSASVLAEGKLEGASVESDGSISAGLTTRRTELKGVISAKSLLIAPDGSAFVGTSNEGKIYLFRDGVARLFAETKQLMVSSLARDARGTLYAGTLPKGKIFAISADGKAREFAAPSGAEHIWALVWSEKQNTLFAATGPQGKLFAIDQSGKAEVYYDSEDSHVMALAQAPDGALYAGTSDRALLLRLRGVNRAEVLYDFEGNELSALALKDGALAVAANLFPKSTPPKPNNPAPSSDANSPAASVPGPTSSSGSGSPQAGKGQLYRVTREGRVEHLFTADEGHISTVEWGEGGVIYAGTGREGHIHRVRPDRDHALVIDVDERQILASALSGAHAVFVTGDAGAIYDLPKGLPRKFDWTSKVLDAGQIASFGQLSWRGQGPIGVSTRSGNTDKPDATWSGWTQPLTAAGRIGSPPARFLQLRVSLSSDKSVVYALEAFYLAQNLPASISEVTVEPPRPKEKAGVRSGPPSSVYKLKWKAENPDSDSLRYRLYAGAEQSVEERPILRESEVITGTEHSWETDGVPDGYYRVRVEASDELENPEPSAQKGSTLSEPFLVDNHPPELFDLRAQAEQITGRARDELGPITKLEYSVDGIEWKLLQPEDRLLDTRDEAFILPFKQLPKGSHTVMIRASDARANYNTRSLAVTVR